MAPWGPGIPEPKGRMGMGESVSLQVTQGTQGAQVTQRRPGLRVLRVVSHR